MAGTLIENIRRAKRAARLAAAQKREETIAPLEVEDSPVPSEKVVVEDSPATVALPEEPPIETVDYSSMTKSQIQEALKERGIAYLPQSTKRILIGLLENV